MGQADILLVSNSDHCFCHFANCRDEIMKTISAPLQVTYKIMVKATAYVRIGPNDH